MNNHFWISHRYDFPSLFLFSHRRFCTEITRGIIAEVASPNLQRCEEQPSRRLFSDFASYHAILDPMYQRGRPEGNIVQETKGTGNKVRRGRSGPTGKINVNLSVARAYRRSIPAGISFAPVSFNGNKFKNLKIKRPNRHFNLRSIFPAIVRLMVNATSKEPDLRLLPADICTRRSRLFIRPYFTFIKFSTKAILRAELFPADWRSLELRMKSVSPCAAC